MKDSDIISKLENSDEYQAFKATLQSSHQGDPAGASSEAAKAFTLALKSGQVSIALLYAVRALIPVLDECTDYSVDGKRRLVSTLARHALKPDYSWMVVTLICEPMDQETGEPGAVIWSSAPLPQHGIGNIWADPDTAERWQEIAPIVADHLRQYHECDPLPLEEIRETLDAAKSRVYRTTNGSANTWLHYVDPDNGRPHSARVSMRRVRRSDPAAHQGDQDHAKYQTYDYD